jgi:hypothetical protein
MKTQTPSALLITLTFLYLLLCDTRAVLPPPDGGYPGGNTAEGQNALLNLTAGSFNTAVGWYSLFTNTIGTWNTAVGAGALVSNTTANNTAIGAAALLLNTTGYDNTANGVAALGLNTTGCCNTALGWEAGHDLTTGDNNIDIGYNVVGVGGESNTIRIGNTNIYATYIRGISGAISSGGLPVFVNSNDKLGTTTSSARFKQDIKPIGRASEAILALRPVSFRYKREIDPAGTSQFGLVA